MCHGFGQKNRMLPSTGSRKQLTLPQSSSTLILERLQKEVEILIHKDLVCTHTGRPTCHLCKQVSDTGWAALLTNWKGALGSSFWFRTRPPVRLWLRSYSLYSPHKPLVFIWSKQLASAPQRLQRPLLRLQQYDAESRYRPGREIYLADTHSRAYLSLSPTDTQRSETEVERIHAVDYLAISEQQLSEIKQETAKDPTLQTLKNLILRGWPENSSSVPKEVSEYFKVRDELAVQDGVVFRGQRCVILRPWDRQLKRRSTLLTSEYKDTWEECRLHWTLW